MSVYDLHFNKDDVTLRNILIGLLATLHDNIYWYNQIGQRVDQKQKVEVPFYFSTTGTERYLQNNFLNNIDFDPEGRVAETFYNKIPRGIVNLNGITVDGQSIVNKYVRMRHQIQEDDGTLNSYNTEAFMVPLILSVENTIYCDSIVDQMKCTEAIIRTFFKNKIFQIDTGYVRIPCLAVFPDDYNNERTMEFGFTERKEFKVSFSLEIKAHLPIFKEGTSFFEGNVIEGFQSSTFIPPIVQGSTALTSNTGAPPASGQPANTFGLAQTVDEIANGPSAGSTSGLDYTPDEDYTGNVVPPISTIPPDNVWPKGPSSSAFPPQGGTA
jgi:hypothetical protein